MFKIWQFFSRNISVICDMLFNILVLIALIKHIIVIMRVREWVGYWVNSILGDSESEQLEDRVIVYRDKNLLDLEYFSV